MRPPQPQEPIETEGVSTEETQDFENMFNPQGLPTGPTGRYLVTFQDVGQQALTRELEKIAGLSVASTADFENAVVTEAEIEDAGALLFENLGIALVDVDPSQLSSMETVVADNESPITSVEPEEYVHAMEDGDDYPPSMIDYLYGYRDAIDSLIQNLDQPASDEGAEAEMGVQATYSDTADLTWGLQATRAAYSACNGSGIRVAVLDTGFDLAHPDFAGRSPITASFVPGASVQDGHGHGTHCIGTACGPKSPAGTNRRYGVATNATILAGKVLNNAGSGTDSWILAGINWALQNNAVIISMSLGARVAIGQGFKMAYEQAARNALNANSLIVAAAGNNGNNVPVSSPANCPSIMAVGALNSSLQLAGFSCTGINPNGGEVNIGAPGVAVYSSVKMPAKYATWNGTSMATPHVAGCAALWAQNQGIRGQQLWNHLLNTARDIGLPAAQSGDGLVQAPSCRRIIVRPPRWWRRWPPYWRYPIVRP